MIGMLKQVICFCLICTAIFGGNLHAQQIIDSTQRGTVYVVNDPRIDALQKKMREHYNVVAYKASTSARGYRLMVLTTSDRADALKVRSKLLQSFPDQQVYMSFQSPYIKLKFGDFAEKSDAEQARKQIAAMNIVNGNVYLVPETVKVKPDKSLLEEDNKR